MVIAEDEGRGCGKTVVTARAAYETSVPYRDRVSAACMKPQSEASTGFGGRGRCDVISRPQHVTTVRAKCPANHSEAIDFCMSFFVLPCVGWSERTDEAILNS